MAEGGKYDDSSSSNSDPWSVEERPEKDHDGKERIDDEWVKLEARKLSPLRREMMGEGGKDWTMKKTEEFFGWEKGPEMDGRRIIVIGMDTSTESEFAFQHYLNFYHCRWWVVIVVHCLPKRSASKADKRRKDLLECEELRRKYRSRFESCKLCGAFIAAECDRPGKLIVSEAEHFKATYVVTGKRRMHKLKSLYVHSVSKYVVEHAPCSVLVFKILRGWKAGDSTRTPSGKSDSPEQTRPKAGSPREQMTLATSQSMSKLLPGTPPEGIVSTPPVVPSPETLPPKSLSPQSNPTAACTKWQLPSPMRQSTPAKRDLPRSTPDAIIKLHSSEAEQEHAEKQFDRELILPAESHSEQSEMQSVFLKSRSEPSKVELTILKSKSI